MKKRIISTIAALLVCAALPIAAAADSQEYDYDVYAANDGDAVALDDGAYDDIDMDSLGKSMFGYILDEAGVLSEDEISSMKTRLEEMSARQKFDFVVYIEPRYSGNYDDIQDFADDIFDFLGYGYGDTKDGALFLLCMDERKWHISTHGYGITAFTDYGIDEIRDEITPLLKRGDYFEALELFAATGDKYVTLAREGNPVDVGSGYEGGDYADDGFVFRPFYVMLSLVVGVIGGFIGAGILKSKMRTVRPRNSAESYVRDGSMVLSDSHDIFLYSTVSQTERPQDDDNDHGGSSTHVSSSGETHGGGGGSF